MNKINNLTNKEKEQIINKLAKGYIQSYILQDLLKNGKSDSITSYCKSARYIKNYYTSFRNAISKLEKELNIKIDFILGKRGGYGSGYFTIA